MARSGEIYKASEVEIKTLIALESMFDFPVDATIFAIGNTSPIVIVDSYVEGCPSQLQKFAEKNLPKQWYWSSWGFYVNYDDLKEFIKKLK